MAFLIKQGDTLPNLPFQIFQPNGVDPYNLTGATVMIAIRGKVTKTALFKKACTVTDAPNGKGIYDWATGDTASAGPFEYEFEITIGSEVITVPVDTYFDLTIVDDVG